MTPTILYIVFTSLAPSIPGEREAGWGPEGQCDRWDRGAIYEGSVQKVTGNIFYQKYMHKMKGHLVSFRYMHTLMYFVK